MIISERQLRTILRKMILENHNTNTRHLLSEQASSDWRAPNDLDFTKSWNDINIRNWLSEKGDVIGAIRYRGKDYFSWGYVEFKVGGRISAAGLAVLVPTTIVEEMTSDLGTENVKLIPENSQVRTLKPNRGNITLHAAEGYSVVIIKEGAPNITLGTYEFVPGDPSESEYVMLALDVFGGIPVFGAGADAVNVFVQLAHTPPRYFGAVLSAMSAIPMYGEVIVAYKLGKVIRNYKTGKEAGKGFLKLLREEFPEGFKKVLMTPGLEVSLAENKDLIYKHLLEHSDKIEKIIPDFKSTIYPAFKNYFDMFSEFILHLREKYTLYRMLILTRQWLNLFRRAGVIKIGGEVQDTLIEELIVESKLYDIYGVDPNTGTYQTRVEELLNKMLNDFENMSNNLQDGSDKVLAIESFVDKLEDAGVDIPLPDPADVK